MISAINLTLSTPIHRTLTTLLTRKKIENDLNVHQKQAIEARDAMNDNLIAGGRKEDLVFNTLSKMWSLEAELMVRLFR